MTNSKKMTPNRHCMIVHAYYPIGETRVEREALALVEAGLTVDVLCLKHKGDPKYEIVDGVHVYRLPVTRNKTGGRINQLLEYLRFFILVFFKLIFLYPRRKYHTIQAHNLPDFLIFSAIIPKLFGTRLILDIHDLMPEFFAIKSNKPMDSFLVKLVIIQERLSCWFADHVITVTDLWRVRLVSRGVESKKVSVVMNVADDRYFYSRNAHSDEINSKDHLHLIYHGTFKEHYGMKELIQSIDLARKEVPGVRLKIQGVGEYYNEMARLVEELGLENEVEINNFVIPVYDLPELISRADMGVIPNRNDLFSGELLPTKMLEYIALNKPVIASKTKVISQYFDENMVLFFNPGDPESLSEEIVYAYQHWDEMIEKRKNFNRFTSIYNWQVISQNYVELVNKLADRAFLKFFRFFP